MQLSTSRHRINADRRLTKVERLAWLVNNSVNNSWPTSRVDPSLELLRFHCHDLDMYWSDIAPDTSPSRKLSDLFWQSLRWTHVARDLVHVLGELREKLQVGIEVYTPRTVSKVSRLFGHDTTKHLFLLGSRACNQLHRTYITIPRLLGKGDRRRNELDRYQHLSRCASEKDQVMPKGGESAFLVLVLQSRLMKDATRLPRIRALDSSSNPSAGTARSI